MAENPAVSVNTYFIRQAVVYPHMKTKGITMEQIPFDISPMIGALHINEGISQSILSGHMRIVDSAGFLENYPLRGEERLTLELEDAVKNVRVWDFFIYKIDDIEVSNVNKTLVYTIHFITFQSFLALNTMNTTSFKSIKIHEMAEKIFLSNFWRDKNDEKFAQVTVNSRDKNKVFSETRRQLYTEPTEGHARLIIPRFNGPMAMDFLVRRAFSFRSPSTSYRFFETSSIYYFVTDEQLFARNLNDPNHTFKMTFLDQLPKGGQEFIAEFNNLVSITNTKRVDTLDDMNSGAYKNHVIEVDLMRYVANLRPVPGQDFDYYERRKNYKNSEGQEAEFGDRHSKEFVDAYFRFDNARQYMIYKDWDEGTDVAAFQQRGEQYYKAITQNRVPFRTHLNSMTVHASGPGRLDIIPGDTIELDIIEVSADTSNIKQNKQLTGRYLVAEISRRFVTGNAVNEYTLIKMNWDTVKETGIVGITDLLKDQEQKIFDTLNRGMKRL